MIVHVYQWQQQSLDMTCKHQFDISQYTRDYSNESCYITWHFYCYLGKFFLTMSQTIPQSFCKKYVH